LNCHGPLRMVKVAQGMPRLAALVHISTAFANIHLGGQFTEERIYGFPLGNADEVFDKIEKMSEKDLIAYECKVLETFKNTYYAGKALMECLLQSRYKFWGLPIVIVRPSGITGALSEPVPGWVEGIAGPAACSVVCGLGVVQEWIGDASYAAPIVPVDWVCKTTLMAATAADRTLDKIPVFQSCTSSHCRLTMDALFYSNVKYWQTVKHPKGRISTDIRFHMYTGPDFEQRFRQRFTKELISSLDENKKELRRMLAKAHRIPHLYGVLYMLDHNLDITNTLALDRIAPKALFGDMKSGINWPAYLHESNLGIHRYLLKEQVDRNVVVEYSWESIQRKYTPTENNNVINKQENTSTTISRL
ncbi:cyclin-dependent kinase inhibitor far1, partial [Dissophora globulifera]